MTTRYSHRWKQIDSWQTSTQNAQLSRLTVVIEEELDAEAADDWTTMYQQIERNEAARLS